MTEGGGDGASGGGDGGGGGGDFGASEDTVTHCEFRPSPAGPPSHTLSYAPSLTAPHGNPARGRKFGSVAYEPDEQTSLSVKHAMSCVQ